MHRILQALRRSFPVTDETEIAIEMASGDLTREYCSFLHREGVQRIHVGVQSLDDRIRKEIDRVDPAGKLLEKVQSALKEGFILSVDLIFGLPGQSLDNLLEDLSTLTDYGVHGFSLYELQIPRNNPLGVNKMRDFVRDRRLNYAMFCEGKKRLEGSGYEQNFFVHFSRPPDKNLYCTYPSRNEECIALGTIADGKAGPWFFTNAPFDEYTRQLLNGQSPIGHGYRMSREEMVVQKIEIGLLGTMLHTSVLNSVPDDLRQKFSELSCHWESAGLLEKAHDSQVLRLTAKGCWFMGNMIEQLRHDLLKGRNVVGKTRQGSPDHPGE
jgi:oxygen-independent coproporphyrinogen-3 oxidase